MYIGNTDHFHSAYHIVNAEENSLKSMSPSLFLSHNAMISSISFPFTVVKLFSMNMRMYVL